jgi:2-aminoadipate transaminase
VRSVPLSAVPATEGDDDEEWQTYALPSKETSYSEQVLADAFEFAGEEGMISLSTGWPTPDWYPVEDLARISAEVFAEVGGDAISYLTAEGLVALREQLAARGVERGFAVGAEEIIVTSGARQAIDLTVRAIVEPGDVVAVETPTFAGVLESVRAAGARVMGIPIDQDGFEVDALERLLTRHEVKLVCLQTASQNPTGRDLSEERKARLAALARERSFFVLEDGVYADLRFESPRPIPLRELAPGHVIYANSLSKVVGGGLRVGWVAVRGPLRERIALLKLESDFHTPTLVQHIAARYLESGAYDRHLEKTIPLYRERRDALLAALEKHLAGEYHAETPAGGHHVWLTLNQPVDDRALYSEAIRSGVTFIPGAAVTAVRQAQTSLRLSFSLLPPDQLEEGVKRLARALREVRRRTRYSRAVPVS